MLIAKNERNIGTSNRQTHIIIVTEGLKSEVINENDLKEKRRI